MIQPLWRTVWGFLKKLKIELPYNTKVPLLGLHSETTKIQKDICTPVFTAAPFTIARTWKQPKRPLADEWTKKMSHIPRMKYYSATKRRNAGPFAETWMSAIQSEVSQKEKTYCMLTHIQCGRKIV